ncbi:hypothetical protein DPM19_03885 [Actinomadura craniellae]|uniref:Uncharacterized protein n=1 Tax=Actinomadura craniellae TaxID=2231787 RepID=A0A365HCU2_9ACTN|nr:hypothetical protein DPM19_03885 [Actinomadura craniellae]
MTFSAASAVLGGSAAAESVPRKQMCSTVRDGLVCISVTGRPGEKGLVGVRYQRGDDSTGRVRIGWQGNRADVPTRLSEEMKVSPNGTVARNWRITVPRGCVRALVQEAAGAGMAVRPGPWQCDKQQLQLSDLSRGEGAGGPAPATGRI